jgi:hypothetical protein
MGDWKDEIPWDRLIDEIEWVTWDKICKWKGFHSEPRNPHNSTDAYWHLVKGQVWDLNCVKMPTPPANWREVIARRPKS